MSNNVPSIRFKGFTHAWEQRKLGEVANVVGGGTPDTNTPEYWGGEIDWYAPAEIGEQIYVTGSRRKITALGLQKSSATMLPVGTVLFTSRAGIGNTAILEKEGATNQGFQSIVPHEKALDSYFIFSRTLELKRYGETIGAGSTFVEVSGKQMAAMLLLIPALPEQTAIGNFFRTLDDTITLYKRKLDGLRGLKKGYLQQMFPQMGERVPRVRFAGFSEDWEEKKLGEIGEIVAGGDVGKAKLYQTGKYPVIANALTNSGIIGYYLDDYRVEAPAVTVTGRGDVGHAKARKTNFTPVVRLLAIKSNNNVDFLANAINNLNVFVESTGVPQLTSPQLANYEICFPTLTEQTAIGDFFRSMDEQITTQQTKLEKLKQLKAAYMQKMFI